MRCGTFPALLGGGLEPFQGSFRYFQVLPWTSASRVENTGRQSKQNCCKLLHIYVHCSVLLYTLET